MNNDKSVSVDAPSSQDLLCQPVQKEQTINNWKIHCNESAAQRHYVQELSKQAKFNLENNVS